MANQTWTSLELPILEAVLRLEGTGTPMRTQFIASEAGISDEHEAARGIAALVQAGYLEGKPITAWGDPVPEYIIEQPTERARRTTGQWPNEDPVGQLVRLLEDRIAEVDDPDQKSKLKAFRDAVLAMGQGLATSVLVELLKQRTGL